MYSYACRPHHGADNKTDYETKNNSEKYSTQGAKSD